MTYQTKDIDISMEFHESERLPSLSTKRTLKQATSRNKGSDYVDKSLDNPKTSGLGTQQKVRLNRSHNFQTSRDSSTVGSKPQSNEFLFGSRFVPDTEQCIRDMEGYTMKYLQESQRMAVLDEKIREGKFNLQQSKVDLDELIQRTHLKLAKVRFEIRMRTRNINAVGQVCSHTGDCQDKLHKGET